MSHDTSNQSRSSGRNRGGRNRRRDDRGGSSSSGSPRQNDRRNGRDDRDGGIMRETFPRPRPSTEPTLGQKILKVLTFGLMGGGKPKASATVRPPRPARPEPAASGSSQQARPPREPREPRPPRPAAEKKPARPPVFREVTSGRLYVGNLSYDAGESDLMELFGGVGQVKSAEVVCHRHNQRSKGYAFVEMLNLDEAKRAVEILNDKDFMGRKLLVSGARSEGPADGSADRASSEDDEIRPPDEDAA